MEKLKDKKVIIGIIVVLVLLIVIGFLFLLKGIKNNNNDAGESFKENTNIDVIKDQTLGVYKFTNTQLYYVDGNSVFKTNVTNSSNSTTTLTEFKIHVYDKDHEEIVTLTGFVGDKVAAGDTMPIEASYAGDLTDAKSIEYELVD